MNNKYEPYQIYPGPVLILAGPGTGKTYTLAKRVKWLVENQEIEPNTISIITFTTEAAKNMRKRMSDPSKQDVYLQSKNQPELVCTLHSLGMRILCQHLDLLGLSDRPNVESDRDTLELIFGDAAQLLGFNRHLGKKALELKKKGNIRANDEDIQKILDKYREIMTKSNAIDFNDQILLACELLESNQEILAETQKQTQHLLVDEYQDLNISQQKFVKLLSNNSREGLYCVGDDDQSIYSFRGGTPYYIRNFEKIFGSNIVKGRLQKSWRCPPDIYKSAVEVVKKFDRDRLIKEVNEFERESCNNIHIYNVPSDKKECEIITKKVQYSSQEGDVLVLVPNRRFVKPISDSLRSKHIDFSCRAFDTKSKFRLLNKVFQSLSNPADNISFRLLIELVSTTPSVGIPGKKSKLQKREVACKNISELWHLVLEGKGSLKEALENSKGIQPLDKIYEIVETLFEKYNEKTEDFLSYVSEIFKFWKDVPSFATDLKNILDQANFYESSSNIKIMTINSAKGLEADTIIIVGLEEGVFPEKKLSNVQLQEKARLFYVALTRAKRALYIFHARKRSGSISFKADSFNLKPSPFITTLPTAYVKHAYIR